MNAESQYGNRQEIDMAALVWRVSQGDNSINIADFMDTAFVIQFDGPGTFIAYQRDKQINCKERIRDYRDAVLWCQEQADRMEQEARDNGEVEPEMPEAYKKALKSATDFLAEVDVMMKPLTTVEKASFAASLAELLFKTHVEGVQYAKDECAWLADCRDADFEIEDAAGIRSGVRWLERQIRVLNGEDSVKVDFDMAR
jgi:hypothetical protein